MSDINKVCISGNLGKMPEVKYFETGSIVCNFCVAVNEWQGSTKGNVTNWFDCKAWGKKAEFIGEYAKTGCHLMVEGKLTVDNYKAKDGTNRKNIYINVDEVKIIDKK